MLSADILITPSSPHLLNWTVDKDGQDKQIVCTVNIKIKFYILLIMVLYRDPIWTIAHSDIRPNLIRLNSIVFEFSITVVITMIMKIIESACFNISHG